MSSENREEVLVFTGEELTETCVRFAALMGWFDGEAEAAWRKEIQNEVGASGLYDSLKQARRDAVERAGGENTDFKTLAEMGVGVPADELEEAHVFHSDDQLVICCVEFVASQRWFESIDVVEWGRQIMAGERGSAFKVRLIDVLHEAIAAVDDTAAEEK